MEAHSLISSGNINIKKEPDYETKTAKPDPVQLSTNAPSITEQKGLIKKDGKQDTRKTLKHDRGQPKTNKEKRDIRNSDNSDLDSEERIQNEQESEGVNIKKEASEDEESDMSPAIKKKRTYSTSLSSPDDDGLLYCEICQLKYDGSCPEHGVNIFVDSAETRQRKGSSPDFNLKVQFAVSRKQKLPKKIIKQPKVCKTHIEDVRTSPNNEHSTESNEILSGDSAELSLAGTSCELRGKVKVKAQRKSHKAQQKIHTAVKPYNCDVCGLDFNYFSDLKIHERTHTGEKPFKCDVCGAGFTRSSDLKRHNRTHTGEKPYICDICGVGFAQGGTVIIHKRTHLGDKPYKCEICGVRFAHGGYLHTHRRTHTGEKPYKCDMCGVGFAASGALIKHKRRHTGEKPYKCDMCDSVFAENSQLKAHKRTHT